MGYERQEEHARYEVDGITKGEWNRPAEVSEDSEETISGTVSRIKQGGG